MLISHTHCFLSHVYITEPVNIALDLVTSNFMETQKTESSLSVILDDH